MAAHARSSGASTTPEHWRDTAHFEWSFADPVARYAERALGLPMSHCSLAVSRGPRYEFVQFGASPDVFPPLLFDLESDPEPGREPPCR